MGQTVTQPAPGLELHIRIRKMFMFLFPLPDRQTNWREIPKVRPLLRQRGGGHLLPDSVHL